MDMYSVFQQMLVLLILLLIGVVAAKTGVVDDESNRRLTRFALVIPQSAQILSSAMNVGQDMTLGRVLGILGTGCVMYGLLILLSLASPYICRAQKRDRGIYSFMTIFGNVGFMGLPVIRALFGSGAVFYAALLLVPFNFLAYTYGIALLSGGGKGSFDWHRLISVPTTAALLSVVLVCVHINIPKPIVDATGMLGDMMLPFSMIIIGSSLGNLPLKEVVGDWRAYVFAPIRLLVCPVVLWAVMGLFVRDTVLLGVITVLWCMPVAAFATMLSIQYGGNERIASRTVFVTTVLSVVTIPLVCGVLPL